MTEPIVLWIDLFCGAGGTQTDQKKFIGNSVVPLVAQKLVEANYEALVEKLVEA